MCILENLFLYSIIILGILIIWGIIIGLINFFISELTGKDLNDYFIVFKNKNRRNKK